MIETELSIIGGIQKDKIELLYLYNDAQIIIIALDHLSMNCSMMGQAKIFRVGSIAQLQWHHLSMLSLAWNARESKLVYRGLNRSVTL